MMKNQTTLLTSDEISKKMDAMVQERQRQETEFRRQWPSRNHEAPRQFEVIPLQFKKVRNFKEQSSWFEGVIQKPLTSDEINDKMDTMIQERERQNAEFQKLNANVTKKITS